MGNMDVLGEEALILASARSTRVSLAGIRIGRYQLSEHRQRLLSRVPSPGDYVKLERDSLEMMDLAYLTAKTDDEFALLRGKNEDVLFQQEQDEYPSTQRILLSKGGVYI